MNVRGIVVAFLVIGLVTGAVAAYSYRAELQTVTARLFGNPAGEISKTAKAGEIYSSGSQSASSEVTRIAVDSKGFSPNSILVPAGANHVLEFTRKVGNTCVTSVVFSSSIGKVDLPVGMPVRVPIDLKPGETLSFTCPMEMYHGKVSAVGNASTGNLPSEPPHNASDIAYWSCSMHPSVHSATPGTCPICSMDLVPVTREEVESGVITVDAQRRQLIGVKTGTVERRALKETLSAAGIVGVDETRLRDVTVRVNGFVGEIYGDFVGKTVRKGDPLFTYYSPEAVAAQEEFLTSRAAPHGGAQSGHAGETRLRRMGVDESQIKEIAASGQAREFLTAYAPSSGTVLEKNVVRGSAITAGQRLYRVADLSVVWIETEVHENDLPFIKVGESAKLSASYAPDATLPGTVSWVSPSLDEQTRTCKVRIEASNPKGELKTGMFVNVSIDFDLGQRLTVPKSALVYAGKSFVAFADLGAGRLEPRHVRVGVRTADFVEVLDGLKDGETVVTSANFLIAAESKLKSGIERW